MSSDFIDCCTSMIDTIGGDLSSYLRSQHTCTSDNHNQIKGGSIFDTNFVDISP